MQISTVSIAIIITIKLFEFWLQSHWNSWDLTRQCLVSAPLTLKTRSPRSTLTLLCVSRLFQTAGVMSVYLFMKRYTAEEMYRPHQGFYRPRLSNCSDYSGQFLHPDAWAGRGRSPSSISSEASLQMNSSNYPALLKCPEYEQMSSSPCWGARPTSPLHANTDGGRGGLFYFFLPTLWHLVVK